MAPTADLEAEIQEEPRSHSQGVWDPGALPSPPPSSSGNRPAAFWLPSNPSASQGARKPTTHGGTWNRASTPGGSFSQWLEHGAQIPTPALLLVYQVTLGKSLN